MKIQIVIEFRVPNWRRSLARMRMSLAFCVTSFRIAREGNLTKRYELLLEGTDWKSAQAVAQRSRSQKYFILFENDLYLCFVFALWCFCGKSVFMRLQLQTAWSCTYIISLRQETCRNALWRIIWVAFAARPGWIRNSVWKLGQRLGQW